MKLYTVFYYDDGERFAYGDYWAASADDAVAEAQARVAKEPAGKPGPWPDKYMMAEPAE